MRTINSIAILLSTFLFFYLMGSFYSVDFNIKNWTGYTRFLISFAGGAISFLFCIIYNIEYKK